MKGLTASDWKKLTAELSGQALFAAKLLTGEMPQDIGQAFKNVGLSLFPEKLQDLTTECSCPDWSNRCKHIAAVYYLLGEEFDRDPFLLFKLRGMSREELVGQLGSSDVRQQKGKTLTKRDTKERAVATPVVLSEPLPADSVTFWNGGSLPEDLFGEVQVPPVAAALPKRLGTFPFWRGTERFLDAIEPIYTHASRQGLEAFLGGGEPLNQ